MVITETKSSSEVESTVFHRKRDTCREVNIVNLISKEINNFQNHLERIEEKRVLKALKQI